MVTSQQPIMKAVITYQFSTKNISFLRMQKFLEGKGIQNNAFMLSLYDSDLIGVDPRDPNLSLPMRQKVFIECVRNYWYFIREVVRIPASGTELGGGIPYKLHRANLAMSFGFTINWNMFVEIPRQNGKTVSALCYYLWCFLYGSSNSKMLFFNKKMEDSKMNLQTLKDIRNSLPEYMRLDGQYDAKGNKIKAPNSVETITNPVNNNQIKTAPAARNKQLATNLGRGASLPFIYFDEYAFIPFNNVIYDAAAPAFSAASKSARDHGKPYGILITTTPGDMLTAEGKEAYYTKETATRFNEAYYDMNFMELEELKQVNTKSDFFYIRFSYLELGRSNDYLKEMIKILKGNYAALRREVLLEWCEAATNSPFEKQDLDQIKKMLRKPVSQIWIGKKNIYVFDLYKDLDWCMKHFKKFPPIIGVDVSGGLSRDSSAITIIDSETTEVLWTFNCNFISTTELAKVLYILIKKYMPNGVINIESNGGFGSSTLKYLIENHPDIKRNLYFELREKVIEERFNGNTLSKRKQMMKCYGLNQTRESRNRLMDILMQRVRYHKDKFVAEIMYNELNNLEMKKGDKIDHVEGGHDDQLFSLLLALYVWMDGKDIAQNWHITRKELSTDELFDENSETILMKEGKVVDITYELVQDVYDNGEGATPEEIEFSSSVKTVSATVVEHGDYIKAKVAEDEQYTEKLKANPAFRAIYCKKFNIDEDEFCTEEQQKSVVIDYIDAFYNEDLGTYTSSNNDDKSEMQKAFESIVELR